MGRCADGSRAWPFCDMVLYAQEAAEEDDVTTSTNVANIRREVDKSKAKAKVCDSW